MHHTIEIVLDTLCVRFELYPGESFDYLCSWFHHVWLLTDIHSAVDKIATLNQLNLSQMRLKLFERWLPSALSSKQDEADMVNYAHLLPFSASFLVNTECDFI